MTAGTLAMPLASLGHGTKCIANAFDYIGVFCGHEVIGMSTAGSVHDLPMYLYRQLFNYDKIYSVLHTQSQPSDGRLADFYHCRWKNMRADYKNMPAGLLNEGKWVYCVKHRNAL